MLYEHTHSISTYSPLTQQSYLTKTTNDDFNITKTSTLLPSLYLLEGPRLLFLLLGVFSFVNLNGIVKDRLHSKAVHKKVRLDCS